MPVVSWSARSSKVMLLLAVVRPVWLTLLPPLFEKAPAVLMELSADSWSQAEMEPPPVTAPMY